MMQMGETVDAAEIFVELCIHEALNGHPNVVEYHGAYMTSPQHFAIVIEKYDMSLDHWIYRTNQRPASSISRADLGPWVTSRENISAHMLEAMAFMHNVGRGGIVHRDIKPANFLLRIEADQIVRCVITDFGFACDQDSCIHTGAPGTVAYMAPEMLQAKPYGQPADVWAMATSLFELWSGVDPLGHLDDYNIEGRLKSDFNPPENLGPLWEDSSQLLDHVACLQELLRECFLSQKDRVSATHLKHRFDELQW
eukprot:TRINITY_DN16539_c0_g1_i1.p1 TRINITY_DN16539_c0_g1~~TRINITY_DN16539_c0_g1_i1.p1  ORF type:complete len:253 (-),score=41.77 TRINITY_DN16539_c0_g1_i1:308-1066(-)